MIWGRFQKQSCAKGVEGQLVSGVGLCEQQGFSAGTFGVFMFQNHVQNIWEPAVTPSEWMTAIALLTGFIGWLTHISFAIGKMIAELHSINEKLGGQLDWIKTLDHQVSEHEQRLSRLEFKLEGSP